MQQISYLLSFILHESGYEKALRTEGCQERLDNLAELKQEIYEYETTCGDSSLEHFLIQTLFWLIYELLHSLYHIELYQP